MRNTWRLLTNPPGRAELELKQREHRSISKLTKPKRPHLMLLNKASTRLAAEDLEFEIVLSGDEPFRPDFEKKIRATGLPVGYAWPIG